MTLGPCNSSVQDNAGNHLAGASIEVRSYTDTPPGALATLFLPDGTTPLSNPFPADARGMFNFMADAGDYEITATLGAIVVAVLRKRIGGGGSLNIVTVSGSYNAVAGEYVIATGFGNFITLPDPGNLGARIGVLLDSITLGSIANIDGDIKGVVTDLDLMSRESYVIFQDDGTTWQIIESEEKRGPSPQTLDMSWDGAGGISILGTPTHVGFFTFLDGGLSEYNASVTGNEHLLLFGPFHNAIQAKVGFEQISGGNERLRVATWIEQSPDGSVWSEILLTRTEGYMRTQADDVPLTLNTFCDVLTSTGLVYVRIMAQVVTGEINVQTIDAVTTMQVSRTRSLLS